MAKGEGKVENREAQSSHDDLNHYVVDALKDIFSSEEQTYDDLLKGFMLLKKEDISPTHDSTTGGGLSEASSSKSFKVAKPSKSQIRSWGKVSHIEDSGSISEEELGPETCTGSILERAIESSGGRLVQLDNYIENEGEMSWSEESDDQSDKIDLSPTPPVNEEHGPESSGNYDSIITTDTTDALVVTLPGEADPSESDCTCQGTENSQQRKPNLRHLQFTTTAVRNRADSQLHGDGDASEARSETCEVTEFALDENFDYDNVALTRKFEFLGNTNR